MEETARDTQESFKFLENKILNCRLCPLCETRTQAVPGHGSITADIMFVGEGPGKQEDEKGVPFVGAAGNFLTELLTSIEISRSDIYITNMVKCRPPNNRDPKPEEIDTCLPYLRQQLLLIKPKVICALGRFASQRLIDENLRISADHGRFYKKKGYNFCALYHPAAALYNPNLKDTLRNDFKSLGLFLKNYAKVIP